MQDNDEKIRNMHMGLLIHTLSNQMKRACSDIGGTEELTPIQRHILKYILLTHPPQGHLPEGYRG